MVEADIPAPDVSGNRAYVYVISAGTDAVKVGLAGNPQQRVRDLQTGHYQRLNLFCAIDCGTDAQATERMAHALLRGKRRSGEWFSAGPEEAREMVKKALDAVKRGIELPVAPVMGRAQKAKTPSIEEEFHPPQPKNLPRDEDVTLLKVLLALGLRSGATDERAVNYSFPR